MLITLKNNKKRCKKKGGSLKTKKKYLEHKLKLKKELKEIITKNEVIIKQELINNKIEKEKNNKDKKNELEIIEKTPLNLSIKKKSLNKSLLNKLSSFKKLDISLFFSKMICCVFILPLIKYNFNIQNSLNDMLRNLKESIFNIDFFKNNFNEIIIFVDLLCNLFKPYIYFKELLEKRNEENDKTTKKSLIKVLNYFMNYETLLKIKLIIDLYKKKDDLFHGNNKDIIKDIISLISSILTIIEIILCPKESKFILCFYISPINNIILYSSYLIKSIIIINKIYNLLKKKNNIEKLIKLKKNGIITNILVLFCNITKFYKENITPKKTIKKYKVIDIIKRNPKKTIKKYKVIDIIKRNPKRTLFATTAAIVGLKSAYNTFNTLGKKIEQAAEAVSAETTEAVKASAEATEAVKASAETELIQKKEEKQRDLKEKVFIELKEKHIDKLIKDANNERLFLINDFDKLLEKQEDENKKLKSERLEEDKELLLITDLLNNETSKMESPDEIESIEEDQDKLTSFQIMDNLEEGFSDFINDISNGI